MNANRFTPTAIAFGLLCLPLLALPVRAQSFQGYTCEGLWEHVRYGGEVIFEETNKWFNNQCVGEDEEDNDDEVEIAQKPDHRRPDVTCPQLPDRVDVSGYNGNTQCQMVGAAGVGRADLIQRGVIDAVDIWNFKTHDVQVCFRNKGGLVFLDAAYAPRMLVELDAFERDGMTCGLINRAGTVALLASDEPGGAPADAPAADSAPATLPTVDAIPASDCQIKLEETLFLRATPGGEIIGLVWLYSEVPVYAITGDWYKIEFEGVAGYISRHYGRVLRGGCA